MSKKTHKANYILKNALFEYQRKLIDCHVTKTKNEFKETKVDVSSIEKNIKKYERICIDLSLIKEAIVTSENEDLITVKVLGVPGDSSLTYKEVLKTLTRAGLHVDADPDSPDNLLLSWK